MEIKEKKVVTEWELKSDVFNFSDETKFGSLDIKQNHTLSFMREDVLSTDVYSKDFGWVKVSITPKSSGQYENIGKLVELIASTFEVKNAK